MSSFFTIAAKNDFKKLQFDLSEGYDAYFFLPFQSISDLGWSFSSIVILPVYYFSFSIILCIEAISSLIHAAYFYPFNTLQSRSYLYDALDEFYFGMVDGILSLAIGIISSASFLSRLIFGGILTNNVDVDFPIKNNQIKCSSDEIHLRDLFELCELQINIQMNELDIIKSEMERINQVVIEFNQQIESFISKLYLDNALIQKNLINNHLSYHNPKIKMLYELFELLTYYPPPPSSENISLKTYQDFYNKNIAHHDHVLIIFEQFRAETYAAINTVKMLYPEYFQDNDKIFRY